VGYTALSYGDVAAAALLLIINGLISLAFKLGLGRSLAISGVRMVIQLALVGVVLKVVFANEHPAITGLVALVMVAVAGFEVRARQTRAIKGMRSFALGSTTLLAVGLLATAYITGAVIGTEPWMSPRVFLPILGMILGNALTGVALVLETMTQTALSEKAAIEARLAMGHARYEAFEGVMRRGLTTALMPIVNAMAVAGVVSLPGMMTGQILAGVDPAEAAKYQIMIMFAIAGSSALAIITAAVGSVWLLTDDRVRLRLDRLSAET
jgi:putative ABC transport system permease protein